jgi:zeta-carotene isomerase
MRVTRHPQMVGQAIWCLAHTLWVGNSFMLTTSLGLMVHHLFGCWHGDRRLEAKYGEAFQKVSFGYELGVVSPGYEQGLVC